MRIDPNALICGDNPEVLHRYIPDESVDLQAQQQTDVMIERAKVVQDWEEVEWDVVNWLNYDS